VFYEIIFETGNHSVAMYNSDDEANLAIHAHHHRAINGENAQETNPQMGPAERVVKVLKYKTHPVDYGESQAFTSDEVKEAFDNSIEKNQLGDLVSIPEVAQDIRDISSPTIISGPHESNFKMQEVGELTGWDNNE
jgi:hypothetical protein